MSHGRGEVLKKGSVRTQHRKTQGDQPIDQKRVPVPLPIDTSALGEGKECHLRLLVLLGVEYEWTGETTRSTEVASQADL